MRPLTLNSQLHTLSLQGNPLCKLPTFRASIIVLLPALLTLDAQPTLQSLGSPHHQALGRDIAAPPDVASPPLLGRGAPSAARSPLSPTWGLPSPIPHRGMPPPIPVLLGGATRPPQGSECSGCIPHPMHRHTTGGGALQAVSLSCARPFCNDGERNETLAGNVSTGRLSNKDVSGLLKDGPSAEDPEWVNAVKQWVGQCGRTSDRNCSPSSDLPSSDGRLPEVVRTALSCGLSTRACMQASCPLPVHYIALCARAGGLSCWCLQKRPSPTHAASRPTLSPYPPSAHAQ